jgi:adenylate cyclase
MERKLTAIFSADVQGYSRLMGEDEEATIRTLDRASPGDQADEGRARAVSARPHEQSGGL